MVAFSEILRLHELALEDGRRYPTQRALFKVIQSSKGRHFAGIVGPRGAGKSVLLRQLTASFSDALYVSADTFPPELDLFELVREGVKRFEFKRFFIDEVHYLKEPFAALKKIYDFLPARIYFSSSVALAMEQLAHDLSRRVRLWPLDYFQFREYLEIVENTALPALTLDDLLAGRWQASHLLAGAHFDRYLQGGLLPFALTEADPMELLHNTLRTIIERDVPQVVRLTTGEIPLLHKLMEFVGRSGVDGINYSSISSNLGITKYKAEQYITALETAFALRRVFPAGTNVVREPKVLLVPPLRLLYRPLKEAIGGLREDFFGLAMRQADISIQYLKSIRGQKTPDYLIRIDRSNIAFEIGGRKKGRSQFKNIRTDRKIVLAPDIVPEPDRLPLHLIGFLSRREITKPR